MFVKISFFFFFFFFFSRDQLTKQKKMSQKTHLAAVFDCRTIIVGYYNYSTCMYVCIQYRRPFPYRADRSARYGKGRLYCMRVHRIYTWPLNSRKAWAANLSQSHIYIYDVALLIVPNLCLPPLSELVLVL